MNELTRLVRALLLDEFKDFDQRLEKLYRLQRQDGFGDFLDACFLMAVRRRFTVDQPVVDIIRFVANVRIVYDLTGLEIDPGTAERMIRAALGETELLTDVDPEARWKIQVILVHRLINDQDLTEEEVDDFLQTAHNLAVQWRTQRAVAMLEALGYTVKLPAAALASAAS